MAVPIYPATFPVPRVAAYQYNVDAGLIRTPMDGGFPRQRRLYDVMPHAWSLEFVLTNATLYGWQTWVNSYGYDYFQIDMTSWLSSQAGKLVVPHIIRFTSNLVVEVSAKPNFVVRVEADLSPSQVTTFNPTPYGNWIDAGEPSVPATDTRTAGRPASPSLDTTTAGKPATPS
jgi:hypothetical protein